MKERHSSLSSWLYQNFWNLIVTLVLIAIAFTTNRIQTEANAKDIADLREWKSILEKKLDTIPNKEYLDLKISPIREDLKIVKDDIKRHLEISR